MATAPPKPQRSMFNSDQEWQAAVHAWRAQLANTGGMGTYESTGNSMNPFPKGSGSDVGTTKSGSTKVTTTGKGSPDPYTISKDNTTKTPPAQAGVIPPTTGYTAPTTDTAPASDLSTPRLWTLNPQDDYTPNGGPDWNGSGDLQKDHPEWWGEVQNFAPEHQDALKKAYAANDETSFQQIRDTARTELYGGTMQTGNAPSGGASSGSKNVNTPTSGTTSQASIDDLIKRAKEINDALRKAGYQV